MTNLVRAALWCAVLTGCGSLTPMVDRSEFLRSEPEIVPDAGEDTAPEAPAPVECVPEDRPDEAGVLDCAGACVAVDFVGDGYCDDGVQSAFDLACAAHGMDGGDCAGGAPAEEEPVGEEEPVDAEEPVDEEAPVGEPGGGDTCTTAGGEPGTVDCLGGCHPTVWIGDGYCDDGSSTAADFACAAFDDDGGDCA